MKPFNIYYIEFRHPQQINSRLATEGGKSNSLIIIVVGIKLQNVECDGSAPSHAHAHVLFTLHTLTLL